jgi:5-carboxymethyl-2-hydroxymuconic-semialdehyde dehydrogenase
MRIQHLIGGKAVESREYFESVNPATQAVLAEVARGGADEVVCEIAGIGRLVNTIVGDAAFGRA